MVRETGAAPLPVPGIKTVLATSTLVLITALCAPTARAQTGGFEAVAGSSSYTGMSADGMAQERLGDARRRLWAGDAMSATGIGFLGAGTAFGTLSSLWLYAEPVELLQPTAVAVGMAFHGGGGGVYDEALRQVDDGRASLGLTAYGSAKLQKVRAMYVVSMACQGLASAAYLVGWGVAGDYWRESRMTSDEGDDLDWSPQRVWEWNNEVDRTTQQLRFAFALPGVIVSMVPAIIAAALMHSAVKEAIESLRSEIHASDGTRTRAPARPRVTLVPSVYHDDGTTGVGIAGRW